MFFSNQIHRKMKTLQMIVFFRRQLLIHWGASLDRPPYHSASFLTSPLHIALAYGNLDCFVSLLGAGADPDHLCEPTQEERRRQEMTGIG
jgi:hypothetical protein